MVVNVDKTIRPILTLILSDIKCPITVACNTKGQVGCFKYC